MACIRFSRSCRRKRRTLKCHDWKPWNLESKELCPSPNNGLKMERKSEPLSRNLSPGEGQNRIRSYRIVRERVSIPQELQPVICLRLCSLKFRQPATLGQDPIRLA